MWTSARSDDRVFEILKTVAHPLRMRVLALLCDREETVGGIAQRLGVRPNAVSQALSILRRERLVAVNRGGGVARYRLEERALRELIPCIERTLLSPGMPEGARRHRGSFRTRGAGREPRRVAAATA